MGKETEFETRNGREMGNKMEFETRNGLRNGKRDKMRKIPHTGDTNSLDQCG